MRGVSLRGFCSCTLSSSRTSFASRRAGAINIITHRAFAASSSVSGWIYVLMVSLLLGFPYMNVVIALSIKVDVNVQPFPLGTLWK